MEQFRFFNSKSRITNTVREWVGEAKILYLLIHSLNAHSGGDRQD